jgi:hypothetical protein
MFTPAVKIPNFIYQFFGLKKRAARPMRCTPTMIGQYAVMTVDGLPKSEVRASYLRETQSARITTMSMNCLIDMTEDERKDHAILASAEFLVASADNRANLLAGNVMRNIARQRIRPAEYYRTRVSALDLTLYETKGKKTQPKADPPGPEPPHRSHDPTDHATCSGTYGMVLPNNTSVSPCMNSQEEADQCFTQAAKPPDKVAFNKKKYDKFLTEFTQPGFFLVPGSKLNWLTPDALTANLKKPAMERQYIDWVHAPEYHHTIVGQMKAENAKEGKPNRSIFAVAGTGKFNEARWALVRYALLFAHKCVAGGKPAATNALNICESIRQDDIDSIVTWDRKNADANVTSALLHVSDAINRATFVDAPDKSQNINLKVYMKGTSTNASFESGTRLMSGRMATALLHTEHGLWHAYATYRICGLGSEAARDMVLRGSFIGDDGLLPKPNGIEKGVFTATILRVAADFGMKTEPASAVPIARGQPFEHLSRQYLPSSWNGIPNTMVAPSRVRRKLIALYNAASLQGPELMHRLTFALKENDANTPLYGAIVKKCESLGVYNTKLVVEHYNDALGGYQNPPLETSTKMVLIAQNYGVSVNVIGDMEKAIEDAKDLSTLRELFVGTQFNGEDRNQDQLSFVLNFTGLGA